VKLFGTPKYEVIVRSRRPGRLGTAMLMDDLVSEESLGARSVALDRLAQELDDLERAYRSPALDKRIADFDARGRDRNWKVFSREFDRRGESPLLFLILSYQRLSELISDARRDLATGRFPSSMHRIRGHVAAVNGEGLKLCEGALASHLATLGARPDAAKKFAKRAQEQQVVVNRLSTSQSLEKLDGGRLLVWGKLEDRRTQVEIQKVAAKECGVNLRTIQKNTVIPKIVHKLES